MDGLSKEYLLLFNAIIDAEQALNRLRENLIHAQRDAEELYLLGTETPENIIVK